MIRISLAVALAATPALAQPVTLRAALVVDGLDNPIFVTAPAGDPRSARDVLPGDLLPDGHQVRGGRKHRRQHQA